jgi:hypothetical protein
MYIVRDKKTKAIIHVNPAPLSQKLKGKAVYFQYDRATMEIGSTDAYELPSHFTINKKGAIVEFTLQQLVDQGIMALAPDEKIVDNRIMHKTVAEKVAEGLIVLPPAYKIVGKGQDEKVVEKTLSEQVAEGLLTLSPLQTIMGEGSEERIVTMSPLAIPIAESDANDPQQYPDR